MNEKIIYKGYIVSIEHDDDVNPREWDNFGTIYSNHRDYDFDNHRMDEFDDGDGINWNKLKRTHIFLKIYAYIHSGITIRTADSNPFSCPWDSGLFGIIAIEKSKVREWFNCNRITSEIKNKVLRVLDGKIKDLDDCLNGNCYGFRILDKDGQEIDSCWGYIGDEGRKDMISEYQSIIDNL